MARKKSLNDRITLRVTPKMNRDLAALGRKMSIDSRSEVVRLIILEHINNVKKGKQNAS